MPIRTGETISIDEASFEVFIYYDNHNNDENNYPDELKARYTVVKKIGSGGFSEVTLAFRKGDFVRCAMKMLKKDNSETVKYLMDEKSFLQELQHPGIIQLLDVVETKERLFLIMDYAAGGAMSNEQVPEKV